ncbi:hypothetical protein [Glutamicibacter arilaitensis]|uniref:hypothetical protein n=1 Tax=Glutamicibacter arilaitensis TaxID=256701 RepID=UPI003A8EF01A
MDTMPDLLLSTVMRYPNSLFSKVHKTAQHFAKKISEKHSFLPLQVNIAHP